MSLQEGPPAAPDATTSESPGTERLLAFSDGVFAIAITLLVLDLRPPESKHGLLTGLLDLWPHYLSYVFSFVIIGIIWAQHHFIFRQIHRSDHVFLLINLLFLMWIVFLPFPTSILAEYLNYPHDQQTATSVYIGTFFVGVIPFNLLWRYAASDNRLLAHDMDPRVVSKITRSYNLGPVLYLVDFALTFISVPASLIVFGLLALFYAVAPLPIFDRIWKGV
jgi:uncharacterized membrane protein